MIRTLRSCQRHIVAIGKGIYFWFILKDINHAARLVSAGIPRSDVSVAPPRSAGRVHLKHLEIDVESDADWCLLRQYWLARELVEKASVTFVHSEQGRLLARFGCARIHIERDEEIFILHEILVHGVYDFMSDRRAVVCDIGANVGIAAICFAQKDNVDAVLGYEPFPQIYECAQGNVALNPQIMDKITLVNAGIGASDEEVDGYFYPGKRGSSGVAPAPSMVASGLCGQLERIRVEAAQGVLSQIREKYPGRLVVAKIDCEGAEYGIVAGLAAAGDLRLVDIVLMEWHRYSDSHDPQWLGEVFADNGFRVFLLGSRDAPQGMLYAVRSAA